MVFVGCTVDASFLFFCLIFFYKDIDFIMKQSDEKGARTTGCLEFGSGLGEGGQSSGC